MWSAFVRCNCRPSDLGDRVPEHVVELVEAQRLLHRRKRARIRHPRRVDHWPHFGHSSTVNPYPGTDCKQRPDPIFGIRTAERAVSVRGWMVEVLMAERTDNSGVVEHDDIDRGAIIQEMDEAKATLRRLLSIGRR